MLELNIKKSTLKYALFGFVAIAVFLSGFSLLSPSKKPKSSITASTETSSSQDAKELATQKPTPEEQKKETLFHVIASGETLGTIIESYGFSSKIPYRVVNAEGGSIFKNIRIGKVLEFTLHSQTHNLEELKYPLSKLKNIVASFDSENNVTVETREVPHSIITETASANITQSLSAGTLILCETLEQTIHLKLFTNNM